MMLSTGAVCQNITIAAQSLNYAVQWVTEWYSYNEKMLEYLGGDVSKDKMAGFIYIGKKKEDPVTKADLKVNEIIIKRIGEYYRDIKWGILSEENVKLEKKHY